MFKGHIKKPTDIKLWSGAHNIIYNIIEIRVVVYNNKTLNSNIIKKSYYHFNHIICSFLYIRA